MPASGVTHLVVEGDAPKTALAAFYALGLNVIGAAEPKETAR